MKRKESMGGEASFASGELNLTALYVGSSLLAPLRQAGEEIKRQHALDLRVATYNLGASLTEEEWHGVEVDLGRADIVFIIHVTDGENAARVIPPLKKFEARHRAVVVINCMPELMRRTRMGKLSFGGGASGGVEDEGDEAAESKGAASRSRRLLKSVGSWMGEQARARRGGRGAKHTQYLRYIERMPALLRFVPNAGRLRDVKHYLYLFCYFLQPTPGNIRSMLLYALKHYAAGERLSKVEIPSPETMPAVGIYHPDAPALFQTFESYRKWYERRKRGQHPATLDATQTVGFLLMRTHIVSGTRRHYDGLIRAIELEGLSVLPVISTFMDNREACARFFAEDGNGGGDGGSKGEAAKIKNESLSVQTKARVSQIVSLTGFSFVGGPAMNDSEAAVEFLRGLNRPFRSAVSLDLQTIESWRDSQTGLNPVQSGMQIAIPEIDGATEPFVYGGLPAGGAEPVALEERCTRLARRLRRWNHLRTAERSSLKLALVVFCFPPNKGNIGTAAELDVFPSLFEILRRLQGEGYAVELPESADALREMLIGGNAESFGTVANVAYRMSVEEYLKLCPYAREIEAEWGAAPGQINSFGRDLLIQGVGFGNVFVAVQPTFGYEGDPMRLLMARGGAPHHGFAALYTYLEKIFGADAVVHTGTHGALEFMPGKQVGLSGECWPDRLIGELPHVYLYSVNNPSEGSIARRRSYAELISYLTPPVADAGLYRELSSLKELILSYRQATDVRVREQLYAVIEEKSRELHFVSE
ncbi:MAG: cobaltochelatase subunit CobN [Acidobacteria bacterium]|nr:cobaltochelatase subunit CobN [Acidobacteriota bacterium]